MQIEFARPLESGFTQVPRAPLGKLATDQASRSPSWIQYSRQRTGLDIVTSPDKNVRIKSPHDSGFHGIFKNFHSGEGIKKVADSYARFTGYVWTEAASGKKQLRIQKYPDTCGLGLNQTILKNIITWPALCVAQTMRLFCFTNSEYAQIRYFPLHYYNHVLCYGELSTFSIKILSRVTNIELTSFWLARGWGRGDFSLLSSPQKSLIVRPMIRLTTSRPVISS